MHTDATSKLVVPNGLSGEPASCGPSGWPSSRGSARCVRRCATCSMAGLARGMRSGLQRRLGSLLAARSRKRAAWARSGVIIWPWRGSALTDTSTRSHRSWSAPARRPPQPQGVPDGARVLRQLVSGGKGRPVTRGLGHLAARAHARPFQPPRMAASPPHHRARQGAHPSDAGDTQRSARTRSAEKTTRSAVGTYASPRLSSCHEAI